MSAYCVDGSAHLWSESGRLCLRCDERRHADELKLKVLHQWHDGLAWRVVETPIGEQLAVAGFGDWHLVTDRQPAGALSREVAPEIARLSARVQELEALFASEDAPPELLAGLRSADQPGGIAVYRMLRARVLGLPSSLPGSMQTGGAEAEGHHRPDRALIRKQVAAELQEDV